MLEANAILAKVSILIKQTINYLNAKEANHLVLTNHGVGEIGKTQLTLEYIWQNYQRACWLSAERV